MHTARAGITGFEADSFFMSRNIIGELPEPGCLTFCLGFAQHRRLERLIFSSWRKVLSDSQENEPLPLFDSPPFDMVSTPIINCRKAWRSKNKNVLLEKAIGEISSELICPYPPGVPMVIPGEVLDEKRISWLIGQKAIWPDQIPSEIKILA